VDGEAAARERDERMAERFRVSNPNVMSETIDGEVIIINLATGTYYSLKDVGAEIWSLVDGGATAEDISALPR
jgi:hypothetical protein